MKHWTCSPRPLSATERAVLVAALRTRPIIPDAERYLGMLDGLTVLGGCGCGCASVDFVPDVANVGSHLLFDGTGATAAGGDIGLCIWGDTRAITGLEVYDMGAGEKDLGLPDPASITSWEEHQLG